MITKEIAALTLTVKMNMARRRIHEMLPAIMVAMVMT